MSFHFPSSKYRFVTGCVDAAVATVQKVAYAVKRPGVPIGIATQTLPTTEAEY